MTLYKCFPPTLGHIKLPMASRAVARAGIGLYAPCRPLSIALQRAAWAALAVAPVRWLPGRTSTWRPPIEEWEDLTARLQGQLGGFDGMAVHDRRQSERDGFAVLLTLRGARVAFVKFAREGSAALATEAAAMTAMNRHRPENLFVPAVSSRGSIAGWEYVAQTPLPDGLHRRPPNPPLQRIVEEIQAGLAELARPEAIPTHWRPMHGDLTPWNLRRLRGGKHALVDWEHASWGPDGADEVLYLATSAAVGRKLASRRLTREAIEFWDDRYSMGDASGRGERRFVAAVRRNLAGMKAEWS